MGKVKVLLAIARKKDNGKIQCGSEEKCIKRVVTDSTRKRGIKELKGIISVYSEYEWRLYETINYRDTQKAYYLMQRKIIGWQEFKLNNWLDKIGNLWKSCLMKPEARHSKNTRVLLDIDNKNIEYIKEFRDFLIRNAININEEYPTKNGHHFIVDFFDKRMLKGTEFEGEVEILRDGLKIIT
jgi:hypothetical protein